MLNADECFCGCAVGMWCASVLAPCRRRGAGGGSGGGAGHWHTDSDFSVEGAEFWTGGLDLVDHPPGSTNHSRSSSEKFPGGTS